LTGGRIETHFHVFGSLAFLAFYRDWRVLVPATIVVAADHLGRQALWPESVYGVANPESWRFLEHAAWVVFEDIGLVIACLVGVAEMRKICAQQVAVERTQGAARELAIAASIQSSILPKDMSVAGLEVSAKMIATEKVGGDYYDVLPVEGGCWIAIGDVAGHGFRAGLAMLQTQSALSALVRRSPDARPNDVWDDLNHTFFDNVRMRLRHDEHMTMSLLRFRDDGRIEIVGAHEEILVWRAAQNRCEVIPLHGTWVGISRTVRSEARPLRLEPGDVIVLYTDGIIEARTGSRMLGLDPVCEVIAREHAKPVREIRDAIFALTTGKLDDDASVMVLRYVGQERAAVAA
jgi:sigma-B regulation protein RsbU (phosphoserine phosphatase)